MARSFRSATSRCSSADFTPFPLSAFGAMAEVAGEIGGVVVLVAMGDETLLSFGSEEEGGAAEISGLGATNGEVGKLPLFPLLIKREGADVSPLRIKNPPRSLPRRRIRRVPLGRERWIRGE